MTHYDENRWVDYVRGLSDSGAQHELESHLGSGCSECANTAALFGRVAHCSAHLGGNHNLVSLFRLFDSGDDSLNHGSAFNVAQNLIGKPSTSESGLNNGNCFHRNVSVLFA